MSKLAKAKSITTSLLGAAAEHYVMSQLLRRGKLAALTPSGMPFADILVSDERGSALSAVQVKARTQGADGGWHMSEKHEGFRESLHICCFVDFGTDVDAQPRCWIVPSAVVADALVASYQAWLHKPSKGGKAHVDHKMRRLRPDYSDLELLGYGPGWLDPYKGDWGSIANKAVAPISN